ncbi:MAG TPA: class I SAM-dependent methyltransferase [Flexivirga sp.]|uniref:class I SAM-dependent methyltransferase n=1 Tax=Flexivirga sp. TaxID=1962927 RepID=UPI002C73B8A8|nr:class I SAM-dependent methyltransferase [Flexivirga sp.]HWC24875.1 class I SAM-dependent methyltransferase [Flexivirga sp.]
MSDSSFPGSRQQWLDSEESLRVRLRQELLRRQLEAHLRGRRGTVLDLGAGQGHKSLELAERGHTVVAAEPDDDMRAVLHERIAAAAPEVRDRITVSPAGFGALVAFADRRFDAVLALGVLMYLPSGTAAVAEAAELVAPGGILAIAVRLDVSAVWRPARLQDWPAALVALEQWEQARAGGSDLRYTNEIGAPARADSFDRLVAAASDAGLHLEQWYGIRIAYDLADDEPAPPTEAAELETLIAVEERLGAMDPFRQLGQLAHLVFRRPA